MGCIAVTVVLGVVASWGIGTLILGDWLLAQGTVWLCPLRALGTLHQAGLCLLLTMNPPSSPQYLLICYKSCWDIAFQVAEEVTPWGMQRSPLPGTHLSPVTWSVGRPRGTSRAVGPQGTAQQRSPLTVSARAVWVQQPVDISPCCPWWLSARCGAAVEAGKRQRGE